MYNGLAQPNLWKQETEHAVCQIKAFASKYTYAFKHHRIILISSTILQRSPNEVHSENSECVRTVFTNHHV